MANATVVEFRGKRFSADLSKDAYIWLINRFLEVKPSLLGGDDFDDLLMPTGTKRHYFARTPAQLFAHNPKLADDSNNFRLLSNGWYADVNLADDRKLKVLRDTAKMAGLKEGADWKWSGSS